MGLPPGSPPRKTTRRRCQPCKEGSVCEWAARNPPVLFPHIRPLGEKAVPARVGRGIGIFPLKNYFIYLFACPFFFFSFSFKPTSTVPLLTVHTTSGEKTKSFRCYQNRVSVAKIARLSLLPSQSPHRMPFLYLISLFYCIIILFFWTNRNPTALAFPRPHPQPPPVRGPFKRPAPAPQSTPLQFNFIKTEHEYFY